MRFLRPVALVLVVATTAGCLHEVPPVPTKGYGAPYAGSGKPIYVRDSRGDWGSTEGGKPITSEQALEATKDPEYELRRQEAKKYNAKLFDEGQTHRSYGKVMIYSGTAIAVAGFLVMGFLPTALRETNTTAATAGAPETRKVEAGGASNAALYGGLLVGLIGVGIAAYGYVGGSVDPPYHVWKTPKDLDRSAYVREKTEKYNEDMCAPPVEEQPGSVETIPLVPGQRKPPPPRPTASARPGAAAPPPASSGAPPPAASGRAPPASSGRPPPASSGRAPSPSSPGPASSSSARGPYPPGPPPPVPRGGR